MRDHATIEQLLVLANIEGMNAELIHMALPQDLIKRDKINLDIFWLKDDALEESANLPAPAVIALDIMEDLQAALEQFTTIAEDLNLKSET